MLQSLLFPGLGLSRINRGKPHWIKGVVAYGSVAGSIYLNRKAVNSFEDYRNAGSLDEVDPAYNNAVKQDAVSEALAYAAIGIWAADMVWTLLGSRQLTGGLSLGTGFETVSQTPLIALRYKF